jgi:dTDP-4-dehydrorhamnose reductase
MKNYLGTIIIIGSTGLLGQALTDIAAERGYTTFGVSRKNSDYNLDATDPVQLQQMLHKVKPAVIINAAAQVNLDACEKDRGLAYLINAGIAASLVAYCREHNAKLCQISTDHYFTSDGAALHAENHSVTLLNEYARTKYAAECFALTDPESLVVRTNIVGYRGWVNQPTFVEWCIAELEAHKPMTLFDDFYTSSIDVKTFSESLFDLLEHGAVGLFNLAARTSSSKLEFVTLLAEKLNLSTSNCVAGSVRSLAGTARAESLGLDVSCAEAVLGYKLPDTQAVINSLVNEYKARKNELG